MDERVVNVPNTTKDIDVKMVYAKDSAVVMVSAPYDWVVHSVNAMLVSGANNANRILAMIIA